MNEPNKVDFNGGFLSIRSNRGPQQTGFAAYLTLDRHTHGGSFFEDVGIGANQAEACADVMKLPHIARDKAIINELQRVHAKLIV